MITRAKSDARFRTPVSTGVFFYLKFMYNEIMGFMDFFKQGSSPQTIIRQVAASRPNERKFRAVIDTTPWPSKKDYSKVSGANLYSYGLTHMHLIRALITTSSFLRAYVKQMEINLVGSEGPQPSLARVSSNIDRRRINELWNEWRIDSGVSGNEAWPELLKSMVQAYAADGRSLGVCKYSDDYNMGFGVMPLPREWANGSFTYGGVHEKEINGTMMTCRAGAIYKPSGRIYGYELYKESPWNSRSSMYSAGYYGRPPGSETVITPFNFVADFSCVAAPWNIDFVPEDILTIITGIGHVADLDEAMNRLMKTVVARLGMGIISRITADGLALGDLNYDADDPKGDSAYDDPMDIIPGLYKLPPNERLQEFTPGVPNQGIDGYRKEILKNESAAVGLDVGTLTGDLERVNYSSLRHGVTQARDTYRNHQANMTAKVLRKVFQRWLEHAWTSGRLKLLSGERTLKEAAISPWRHRSYEYIDPTKDSVAVAKMMSMGLTSPQIEASARGRNALDILDDFAEAKKWADDLGIGPEDLAMFSGSAFGPLINSNKEMGENKNINEN